MRRRFRNGEFQSLGLGSGSGLDSGLWLFQKFRMNSMEEGEMQSEGDCIFVVVVRKRLILAELVLGNKNGKNERDDGGDGSLVVLKEIQCMDGVGTLNGSESERVRTISSSSAFMVIYILHSLIAVTCRALMMFYTKEVYTFGYEVQTATKLLGSMTQDQLLIKTFDSFSDLLLVAIGFLFFTVSFVKDRDFQVFFAKGCTLLYLFMGMWRIYFECKVEDLAWDWLRQTVGDLFLALPWVFFLVSSWREKYD
ncbi:uncharacterized protein LOC106780457 [Vigna radiata var. radiata]|uniref:Uncharacterized protein LOC106780457 n=1 Tax=Vigna radiata var. radiata TaxID=3916 RepID=A0A1S3W169_VIGRR|nr:uncharacterized protein LOC106780457 [Vigna radiata var. radiata]